MDTADRQLGAPGPFRKRLWLWVLAWIVASPTLADTVPVQCTAEQGGSLSPSGQVDVAFGSDLAVTIAPTGSYHISDVFVDGLSVGPVESYTFVSVEAPHTIEATFHIPWATDVVTFVPGTNSEVYEGSEWVSAQTVLGEPSRRTTYGWDDVTMFQPPWVTNQIISVGAEGALVVAFDHAISNDMHNPYGVDLLVFGNALFLKINDRAGSILSEPGHISVSQDGTNWFEAGDAVADALFPTLGYTDSAEPINTVIPGTIPTSFVKPVDPSTVCTGKTFDELKEAYDGSGGGAGVDIGLLGLDWIRYVKVWQPSNQTWSTEIDAFADVAPSLERELAIGSAFGRCEPAAGVHVYTSGVPVACSVTEPVIAVGVGTQIVCTGWSGTGSVMESGTNTHTRFTIAEDSGLAWQWSTQYWLTAIAQTGGSVSVTGNWVNAGEVIEIVASEESGYVFAGWVGDVSGDTNAPTVMVTMDESRTLTAQFVPNPAPTLAEWMDGHDLTNGVPESEGLIDHDEDGMSSRDEYLAGTDPNDSNSLFRVIDQGMQSGSNYLTWLAGTNGSAAPCEVWCSSNLVDWVMLDGAVAKSPTGTTTWWHASESVARGRYYQIRVREE